MEQSPSWEANRSSVTQEIPCIIRNPEVHHRIHLSLSWLSWIKIQKIHFNIIFPSNAGFSRISFFINQVFILTNTTTFLTDDNIFPEYFRFHFLNFTLNYILGGDWGYRSNEAEDNNLLGCYSLSEGEKFLMSRRIVGNYYPSSTASHLGRLKRFTP